MTILTQNSQLEKTGDREQAREERGEKKKTKQEKEEQTKLQAKELLH